MLPVPDPYILGSADSQPLPVRRKAHIGVAAIAAQDLELCARLCVPNTHSGVGAAGGHFCTTHGKHSDSSAAIMP